MPLSHRHREAKISFLRLYGRYLEFKPFTDSEAWMLFRLAAISEAVGWSMLIIGVCCEKLPVSWHEIPVQIAGRVHGMLFLTYIVAALVLSPSLQWRWVRTLTAGIASVPPYGSLLFEQWEAQRRKHHDMRIFTRILALRLLSPDAPSA